MTPVGQITPKKTPVQAWWAFTAAMQVWDAFIFHICGSRKNTCWSVFGILRRKGFGSPQKSDGVVSLVLGDFYMYFSFSCSFSMKHRRGYVSFQWGTPSRISAIFLNAGSAHLLPAFVGQAPHHWGNPHETVTHPTDSSLHWSLILNPIFQPAVFERAWHIHALFQSPSPETVVSSRRQVVSTSLLDPFDQQQVDQQKVAKYIWNASQWLKICGTPKGTTDLGIQFLNQ